MRFVLPSRLRSTTTRFIVLIFVAQFAAMIAVAYFVRSASEQTLLSEQKALVSELRDELVSEFDGGGRAGLVEAIKDRIAYSRGGIAVILLTDPEGRKIAGNLENRPPNVMLGRAWQIISIYRPRSTQVENIGLRETALSDGSSLLTGHVIDSGWQLRRANERASMVVLLISLPIALLLAMLLVKLINRRIAAIAQTAEAVSTGDLSRRVEGDHTNDAFDRLGQSINVMLDRIQLLVSELRMVTDGLAHDLRSPITRMKSVIERAVIETREPACLATLEKVSTEAETLLAMLTTALQISRAEAGIGRERFELTELAALLSDIVEIYGPLAEDSGFALHWSELAGATVWLHRELVSQALGNLIENALKYASGGNRIDLSAESEEDQVVLSVADNGVGISFEQRDLALKRFGRLDPARHVTGSGLGLSLVDAIARMHGGALELGEGHPGLVVRMRIAGQLQDASGD